MTEQPAKETAVAAAHSTTTLPTAWRELVAMLSPNRVVSRTAVRLIVVLQVAVGLAIWWRSPFAVLPTPVEVVAALRGLWFTQGLSYELWTSFTLNLQALALATAFSLGIAYLTVLPFFRPLAVVLSKGRFLSLVGLTFVFTLVVGGGHPLKLWLLVLGITVFFVTSMIDVVNAVGRDEYNHARTLKMGPWRVVGEVIVLGTADRAIEALRQNAAIGWMMLTMVEGISRSEGGIGAMLLNQSKHFRLAEVFAIQLTILLLGMVQDYGIGVLKRIVCPYAELALERK